jgi:hypothetical protein
MEVYLGNTKIKLNPADSIAKGGEADIFKHPLDPTKVVKLYKQPNHPDLAGMPSEQEAAKFRLQEHQTKLLAFPKGLPANVIAPGEIAYTMKSKARSVAGYSMPFIDGANTLLAYSDMNFKKAIPFTVQMAVLRNLREAVAGTHRGAVTLGDFNDLNVLVVGDKVYLIDLDSAQFGQFLCYVFTQRFLDPLLASFDDEGLSLSKPYVSNADWYAFTVMVMQTLLSAGPYSGITDQKNQKGRRLKYHERVAARLTVFDSAVRYPRNAVPFSSLPDELNDHLYKVFVKDQRGEFPSNLLQIVWQKCSTCGMWHARPTCPGCAQPAPAAVKQKVRVRGNVTSTRVFKTHGNILFASVDSGKLQYIYHESDKFYREDHPLGWGGPLDPLYRYRIQGKRTLMGRRERLVIHDHSSGTDQSLSVDVYSNLAMFDSNRDHYYWIKAGQLQRDHAFGSEQIGQVLTNQTLFWVGNKRGFGFYNAGDIRMAFIFAADGRGINDSVPVLDYTGQLVDSTAVFGQDIIWVFYSAAEKGRIVNRCRVYSASGQILAQDEAERGDDHWLGQIRGKTALGNRLLSITSNGVVRLDYHNTISIEAEYPDTAPFVHQDCHLYINPDGLYVVDDQEIRLITIK